MELHNLAIVSFDDQKSLEDKPSTHCNQDQSEIAVDYSSAFTTSETFLDREELANWVRDTGKTLGLVIIVSKSDSGGHYKKGRIWFGCKRGGSPRFKKLKGDEGFRGSKKCGCPFKLKGQQTSAEGSEWKLMVICGTHNHLAAEYLEGHSYAGRLTQSETSVVMELSKCHVRPKDILISLKMKDPKNASTMKTIYNARHKLRVNEQGGRMQMQHLLFKISECKYIEWHRSSNQTEAVTDLFWAHPVGVELLRAFPGVIILVCTYKTNRYKYPLLEIVGVTSTNMSFCVAFAFLERERESNYAWALDKLHGLFINEIYPCVIVTDRDLALVNVVQSIFPSSRHLLCRWHINRNVLAYCKKYLEQKTEWEKFFSIWKLIMLSETIQEYDSTRTLLMNEFRAYPDAVKYVTKTWLDPYKDKFVAYWTNTCLHRDNVTTNRAESAHAKLKRQLRTSQGNFENCWSNIHSLLELQHTEIKASFEKSLTMFNRNFMLPEFRELLGVISIHALNLILNQLRRAASIGVDAVECGCVIRQTHNLPCAHEIAMYQRDNRAIPLDCIDLHWRKLDMLPVKASAIDCLNYEKDVEVFICNLLKCDHEEQARRLKKLNEISNPASSALADPVPKVTPHVARRKRKHDYSTKRNPCAFELIASETASRSPLMKAVVVQRKCWPTKLMPKRKPMQKESTLGFRTSAEASVSELPLILEAEPIFHSSIPKFRYQESLPNFFLPYISNVGEVKSDGNCGFRVIADSLGFGEDQWSQIRRDLLTELDEHELPYISLFGSVDRFVELRKLINYFREFPNSDHWMTLPDMDHLIASRFNLVLFFISNAQCLTFLPLRSPPPASILQVKEVSMAFIGGCHFVPVKLNAGHPVPNIAVNWHRNRDPVANGWQDFYIERIEQFKQLVPTNIATQDIIDL